MVNSMLCSYSCVVSTCNCYFILCLQKLALEIKAQLSNVTDLKPEGSDFRWYIKVNLYSYIRIPCTILIYRFSAGTVVSVPSGYTLSKRYVT